MKDKLTYKSALNELGQIQTRLQGELNDLDRLIEDVRRAHYLINWCNRKLEETEALLVDVMAEGVEEE